MPRMALACLTVLVAAVHVGARQQRDAPLPQTAGSPGSIAGVVVGTQSGQPVPFARITLSGRAGSLTESSDAAGQFVFSKVRAGAYTLEVRKPGYVPTIYGQARPGTETPGRPIRVEAGQRITDLTLPLSQGSSIAGLVRTRLGEPVYKATVRASRWVTKNGVRTLETVATDETDERGAFRIPLLPPRRYFVSAEPPEPRADLLTEPLAPVFFPSTLTVNEAESISLAEGEHRSGLTMTLPAATLSWLRGLLLDSSGRPVPNVVINVASSGVFAAFDDWGTVTRRDGTFELANLPPATYVIRAGERFSAGGMRLTVHRDGVSISRDFTLSTEPGKTEPGLATTKPMGSAVAEVVAGQALELSVTMQLEQPRAVSGRIMLAGSATAAAFKEMGVRLVAADSLGDYQPVNVAPDGTFRFPQVAPGVYRVALEDTADLFLTTAIAGGVDVLDSSLRVPRDRDLSDLVLTVSDRSSELLGRVTDAAGRPVSGRTVVVFAQDESLWTPSTRRLQSAITDADGRYQLRGLAAGDYRIVVIEDVEPDEWLDPLVLRQWLPIALPITIRADGKHVQDFQAR